MATVSEQLGQGGEGSRIRGVVIPRGKGAALGN